MKQNDSYINRVPPTIDKSGLKNKENERNVIILRRGEYPQGRYTSCHMNFHGIEQPEELIDFCGQEVLDQLDRQLRERHTQNTLVYFQFEGDGRTYRIWKGIGNRKGYNVYIYAGE